jgi:hypothetical protein
VEYGGAHSHATHDVVPWWLHSWVCLIHTHKKVGLTFFNFFTFLTF